MKNFKRTLLAATIAATCGLANAGEVTVTTQTHSKEGLMGVTTDQTSNAITYEMGTGYLAGDKITFTFPENSVVLGSFPTTLALPATDGDNDSVGDTDQTADGVEAIAGVALGQNGSTSNSVTYRVLSVTQPRTSLLYDGDGVLDATGTPKTYTAETSLGNVVDLGAIGYTVAALLNADITVTVSAEEDDGDPLDNSVGSENTGIIATAKSQFGTMTVAASDQFDGIIDVGSARISFAETVTTDTLEFVVNQIDTTGWINLATVNTTGVTLYGEAGKLDGLDATNFSTDEVSTEVFTEAAASLALTYTGMVTNDVITFTAVPADDIVLKEQDFNIDSVFNFTSVGAVAGVHITASSLESGSWELNGASVNIPYMPYSNNASQIIYVTNEGSQVAEISVTAFDETGKEYELGVISTVAGTSVKKITSEVETALNAAGFTDGKVSLTVTVNAPDEDITVYASYQAGANRGFVNTDQYKGKDGTE